MYLLDTDTLSEMKKIGTPKANAKVALWAAKTSPHLCWLSTITILEVTRGILRLQRRDPAQAAHLHTWLEDQVLVSFADRILSFDLQSARVCAALHVPEPRAERDAMIASIALVHGFIVITRNVKHFGPMNVPIVNPWD